ncbi:error-prone DNA polymerase, partial [Chitinimonas sp.]|uniref:error-prone DNA polymerase n=1 Tax=Chitinimonas sp. TaxID=1934313 RepID=UPI0035B36FF5
GDVHMHDASRQALQDVLTAIRLHKPVSQCGMSLHPNDERYLRPLDCLALRYPQALLDETTAIADRCTFDLGSLRYEYADELVPPGISRSQHLAALTRQGLARRYPEGIPDTVLTQVARELQLIADLNYEPFFLTVEDIVRFARGRGILCQGRGSAANSAVCYALGITEVDPARGTLLFERFISRERNEPPDIDVDFEHERREEVIQYIYRRYTRDRAALAATVITYRPKSAVRDVGRALGLGEEEITRLTKTLSWWDKKADLPARLAEAGFDPASRTIRLLMRLVELILRFPRHLSQHVGGFIISAGPLARLVPIENAAMPERTIIQWDKDDLEAMGLLKVDVLALGMLSAIRKAIQLVAAIRQQPFTFQDIPPEDPETYDMICKADTVGVFQIESRAQMSMLPRLQPRCYYDLVIEIALIRPGPIVGDMVHPYLRRRRGEEPIEDLGPEVNKVLARTLGVPIFQEQVMALAVVAAGFTPGEADELRRAMASWRASGKMEQYRAKLYAGLMENHYPESFAQRILKQIEGFAEYGFPESHSASFAILVYASSWLKRHYPAAFTCALINSQPMGFYSPSQLVQDALRHGVEIRPIDIQYSEWDCTLEPPDAPAHAIRLGLRLVSGLSEAVGRRIAAHRPAGGYANLDDLQRRAGLNSHSLRQLAAADATASLAGHRRKALWDATGINLYDDLTREPDDSDPVELPPPSLGADIVSDYASTGLTLRPHPLSLIRAELRKAQLLNAAEIQLCQHGQPARTCGIVVCRQRPSTAAGVTFVTLEDETGNTNVIVWRNLAEKQRKELLGAKLLAVYGVIQRDGDVVHLLAIRLADKSEHLGKLDIESRNFR